MSKKQTAFRLSESLIDRMRTEAKRQTRSMNNLLEVLLDKYLPKEP